MTRSSLHPYPFMFGSNADEELLLALLIAGERAKDGVPEVTTRDLWELQSGPEAIHPSLRAEWPSDRKVGLALKRLRDRKLVTARPRDPYEDKTLCWELTLQGYRVLDQRSVLDLKRPA